MNTTTTRAEAGTAYAAAAAAYVEAWVELHAHDRAINRSGFGGQPEALAHPDFLSDVSGLNRDPGGRASARADQIIAQAA
jgi:hypothetical protein